MAKGSTTAEALTQMSLGLQQLKQNAIKRALGEQELTNSAAEESRRQAKHEEDMKRLKALVKIREQEAKDATDPVTLEIQSLTRELELVKIKVQSMTNAQLAAAARDPNANPYVRQAQIERKIHRLTLQQATASLEALKLANQSERFANANDIAAKLMSRQLPIEVLESLVEMTSGDDFKDWPGHSALKAMQKNPDKFTMLVSPTQDSYMEIKKNLEKYGPQFLMHFYASTQGMFPRGFGGAGGSMGAVSAEAYNSMSPADKQEWLSRTGQQMDQDTFSRQNQEQVWKGLTLVRKGVLKDKAAKDYGDRYGLTPETVEIILQGGLQNIGGKFFPKWNEKLGEALTANNVTGRLPVAYGSDIVDWKAGAEMPSTQKYVDHKANVERREHEVLVSKMVSPGAALVKEAGKYNQPLKGESSPWKPKPMTKKFDDKPYDKYHPLGSFGLR